MKSRFMTWMAVLTAMLAAVVLAAQSARAQDKPDPGAAAAGASASAPAMDDFLPSVAKDEMGTKEELEDMLRGDLGEKAGDMKKFDIRTDDDISALAVGDLYKNEETAYKIVAIKRKSAKGGEFTAQRIAGQSDPQRRWLRLSGSGPQNIITRMTMLDFYLQGGPFMHCIALLCLAMVVLVINDSLLYRRKKQCPPEFVAAAEAALDRGDLTGFGELARNAQGLMPFICRHMTQAFDTSTMDDIRKRVESATATHISRMRIPVRALNLVAATAPLLGLLGTITGMVTVFEGIAGTSNAAKASILASGIRTALFTTVFGLTVAIPALFVYFFLNQKHGAIVGECEIVLERFMQRLAQLKRAIGQGGDELEADAGRQPAAISAEEGT